MKKRKIVIGVIIVLVVVIVVGAFPVRKLLIQKKLAELGKQFTLLEDGNGDLQQRIDITFPAEVLDEYEKRGFIIYDEDDYNLRKNVFHIQCELQNYKVIDVEKTDTTDAENWIYNESKEEVDVKTEYLVTATMEERFRSDYKEADLEGTVYAKDMIPFCYNGSWSDWEKVEHKYLIYKLHGKWYVLNADDN